MSSRQDGFRNMRNIVNLAFLVGKKYDITDSRFEL